jgi:AraC family transcriptional regulator of adaptative response / DNA-3-methyladenine glycosylase II
LLTDTALPTTLATLTDLLGIGHWSAPLIALRTPAWPDAWPASDIALLQALGQTGANRDIADATTQAETWRSWRSYAVVILWRSLPATR